MVQGFRMWIAWPWTASAASISDSGHVGWAWTVRAMSSARRAHLDRERRLGDEVGRLVAHGRDAEHLVGLRVRDDLHEAFRRVDGHARGRAP